MADALTYDAALERLLGYLDENLEDKPEGPITPQSSLARDLQLDSIQSFEMVAQFEDDWDVSISLDHFQTVETVEDLAKVLAAVVTAERNG